MNTYSETSNQNLKNKAYDILKGKIISCEYAPGSILNESQLANELGLSRTPVREAISILEREGFLRVVPKKGILVTDILLNDIAQVFQARIEMEPVILKIGGPNMPKEEIQRWIQYFESNESSTTSGYKADTAMHLSIIDYCNNSYIIDMMHKVFDKNMRIIISSKENEVHLKEARREHIEILQCMLNDDYDDAAEKMRIHVSGCRNAALDFFYSA